MAGTALAKTIYVSNNLPLDLSQAGKRSAVRLGVLEPLQTRTTVNGQIEELREVLQKHAETPATLIGFSWGAWLVYLLAAKYPKLVKKLILVSSGAFEEKYTKNLMKDRLERLNESERNEVEELMKIFQDPETQDKDKYFGRFGELMSKADNYDPMDEEDVEVEIRADIYNGVWPDAAKMRRSGELLDLGKKIECPVVAIHGDYDPTPADGVRVPLERVLEDFQFILLEKCGHKPWIEKYSRGEFYRVLREEIC